MKFNFFCLSAIIFTVFQSLFEITCGYQLFNVWKCNNSRTIINLDLYNSLVINGSFRNLQMTEKMCRFSFLSKEIKPYDLILFNLQIFETSSSSHIKNIATLVFSTKGRGLFQFNLYDSDMVFRNMFVTRLLVERNFNWNDELHIDLKLRGPSQTNIILVISPGSYCLKNADNETFRCEEGYKEQNICVANHFKCDGWNNCPYRETDESPLICHSQFIHHILIPSLILSSTVFVLGWILLKITPCLLEQRRMFLMRRNHMLLTSATRNALNGRSVSPLFQNFHFNRRLSESNLTPENIPNSPPKYQNIYQPNNVVDHHLPPSYSEETDIGVIPDFFKRFFGKIRNNPHFENPEINIQTYSERQKNHLDSQSDPNNPFVTVNKTSQSDCDTLTSITSTEVF